MHRIAIAMLAVALGAASSACALDDGAPPDPTPQLARPLAAQARGADTPVIDDSAVTAGKKLLIIEKKGVGQGTISGPDFECGPDCTFREIEYDEGSPVQLTAISGETPDGQFSAFAGWGVDCTGTGVTCDVQLDRSRKVEATFQLDGRITINRVGAAGGLVTSSDDVVSCGSTCTATYPAAADFTLRAAPQTVGQGLVKLFRWSGGGCFGSQETCQIALNGEHLEITAEFRNALTISPVGNGGGSIRVIKRTPDDPDEYVIDCGGDCEGVYAPSDIVEVEALPAAGSDLKYWGDQCTEPNLPGRRCRIDMSQPHTLRPWLAAKVALEIRQAPLGGSVKVVQNGAQLDNCTATPCIAHPVVYGSTLTLTATGDATHVFAGWASNDGSCTGTNPTCTVAALTGRIITAQFELKYRLTVNLAATQTWVGSVKVSNPAGKCQGSCVYKYPAPTSVNLIASPVLDLADCRIFSGWVGGGCGPAASCTVAVNDVKTVTATWSHMSGCVPP